MSDKNKVNLKPSNTPDEIDLGHLLGTLIDHRWLIIGVTALFALVGITYALFATPVYRADALVQVERNVGNAILSDISQMLPSNQPQSAAEIELIKSRMVINKTIEELNLDTVVKQKYFPFFGKKIANFLNEKPADIAISRLSVPNVFLDQTFDLSIIDNDNYILSLDGSEILKGKVGKLAENGNGISLLVSDISAEKGTVFLVTKKPILSSIADILDRLDIQDKGKDTGVLNLSLVGDDPKLIRRTLDSITSNYLQQNVERKSEEAGKSLAFLKDQLPIVRSQLDSSEDILNLFRQKNDSVDLSLEAKSVLETMVSVESQLNELTFKEAEISKLYTKEHPAYRALLEKRGTLELEKEKLNKRVSGMPKTQQEILRLTRDVQAGQEVYMQLLNKQQELSISKASTVGNVRVIDKAVTQPKPVKPRKFIIVVLAVLIGGFFAIASVLVKSFLHRGIENPEQLESIDINVYASIPLSEWQQKKDREFRTKHKSNKKNVRADALLAINNPADLAIEAIRSLRTSLHFAMLEAKNNILVISGSSPAIGKTFVSANLSAVIAQTGQKVLLIDSDMRKGYTHELLGTINSPGLSEVLSNQKDIKQAIYKTQIEGMDFIPRGQIPPNPSELLMSKKFQDFLNWAKENYDLILIDTPPILAVTDAAIISHHAGTSLLVARFGESTVKEIEVSMRRFEQNGTEIKGVILNAVVKKAASYYGYGNYDYYAYEYTSNKN